MLPKKIPNLHCERPSICASRGAHPSTCQPGPDLPSLPLRQTGFRGGAARARASRGSRCRASEPAGLHLGSGDLAGGGPRPHPPKQTCRHPAARSKGRERGFHASQGGGVRRPTRPPLFTTCSLSPQGAHRSGGEGRSGRREHGRGPMALAGLHAAVAAARRPARRPSACPASRTSSTPVPTRLLSPAACWSC